MATLEKIRKRSVLLLVIIGVALLAFIIGDFLNSSRSIFGSGTTVAKVDGEKIDYIAFQQRYSELSENNKQNQQMDAAAMQNQVLEQMINEVLLNEEYDALGIDVSDKVLSEYMFKYMPMQDQNFGQTLSQLAQQLGQNEKAAALLQNSKDQAAMVQNIQKIIFNPSQFGLQTDAVQQAQAWWMSQEKAAEENIKQMSFYRLVAGGIQANALEIAAMKAERSVSYDVQMVSIPYASLNDNDYKVNDADIKAAYNEMKEMFALDYECRRAYFIAVPIVPSQDDLDKANAFLATVDSTLRASDGVESVRHFAELTVSENEYRQNDLNRAGADLKNFADSAAVGKISKIYNVGDDRKIYRLLNKTSEVDTVNVALVTVQGDKKKQDEVLAALKGGKTIDEVANDSTVIKQEPQDIDVFAAAAQGAISAEQKAKILGTEGFFIFDSNDQGAVICKVESRKAAKTVYKVGEITYTIEPSKQTRNALYADLQEYVNKNNTAKAFYENTAKAKQAYSVQTAVVSSEAPQLNNVKSSAKLIQWLFMDASKGDVSAIQQDNDQLLVAALAAVYDEDYAPLSDPDIKSLCEQRARNNKKAETLAKQYTGKAKDINAYAALMKKEVQTTRVGGGAPTMEPALGGQVPFAKQGKVYGPVKGESSLFVYTVTGKEQAANPVNDQELAQRIQAQMLQTLQYNFPSVLRGSKKVKYNIVNFR